MLSKEDLKKLEELKGKVEEKQETGGIIDIIRKVIKEELDHHQTRIYKGLSNIIFGGRDEVKEVDAKVSKLLKMADESYIDDKYRQMQECINKLNELMKGE